MYIYKHTNLYSFIHPPVSSFICFIYTTSTRSIQPRDRVPAPGLHFEAVAAAADIVALAVAYTDPGLGSAAHTLARSE